MVFSLVAFLSLLPWVSRVGAAIAPGARTRCALRLSGGGGIKFSEIEGMLQNPGKVTTLADANYLLAELEPHVKRLRDSVVSMEARLKKMQRASGAPQFRGVPWSSEHDRVSRNRTPHTSLIGFEPRCDTWTTHRSYARVWGPWKRERKCLH